MFREKAVYLQRKTKVGELAEWLGNGLQNRVQQFDSATHLEGRPTEGRPFFIQGP